MAYTADPASDEGMLRVLISDTTTVAVPVQGVDYEFSDADLTGTLDLNGDDLWAAAADLCRALSAKFTAASINLGLGKGDIKIDNTKRAEGYLKLAETFDKRSGNDGAVEYMDSVAYGITSTGRDVSEYVGDN